MPASGSLFFNRIIAFAKKYVRGLMVTPEGIPYDPSDSCTFEICTGSTDFPDITMTGSAQTVNLIPTTIVPVGFKCYLTSCEVYASTAASGGTSGTVSLTIEDTAGTDIATFTQAALSSGAYIGLPVASPGSGITDTLVKTMGASTAANAGIQALVSTNSSAGVVRIRLRGYFAQ